MWGHALGKKRNLDLQIESAQSLRDVGRRSLVPSYTVELGTKSLAVGWLRIQEREA